jgi:hypothetical protein
MTGIDMLSVVAMLEDLPEEGLVRGQVGTVVETWVPGVYEVEFCDDTGKTYAIYGRAEGRATHAVTPRACPSSRLAVFIRKPRACARSG